MVAPSFGFSTNTSTELEYADLEMLKNHPSGPELLMTIKELS